jgi:hypothetical protein
MLAFWVAPQGCCWGPAHTPATPVAAPVVAPVAPVAAPVATSAAPDVPETPATGR